MAKKAMVLAMVAVLLLLLLKWDGKKSILMRIQKTGKKKQFS